VIDIPRRAGERVCEARYRKAEAEATHDSAVTLIARGRSEILTAAALAKKTAARYVGKSSQSSA